MERETIRATAYAAQLDMSPGRQARQSATLPTWTQGFLSPRYASTTPVMYSASRSLMARISDKVKGSGCCAQLTAQFADEEMISVTRACRSMGVGRGMVFPFYCRPTPNLQIPAGRWH